MQVSPLNTAEQLAKVGHWRGDLHLSMALRKVDNHQHKGQKTVLAKKQQNGPYTVQRAFYPEGGICHLILLHPPGGLVEGDSLSLVVDCAEQTQTFLTTPSAAKVYQCEQFEAQQHQLFNLQDRAMLEWFPQETIVFNASKSVLQTKINLYGKAKFGGWEIVCLGRALAGDYFTEGRLTQTIQLNRDDKPILIERLLVADEAMKQQAWGLNGFSVSGTFLMTNCDQTALELAQTMMADAQSADVTLGVTLIDDVLICRALAQQSRFIKTAFTQVWQKLRQTVFELPALSPRIWNT